MAAWPITISWPCGPLVSGIWTWAVQLAQRLAERGRDVRLVVHGWKPHERPKGYEFADLGPDVKRRFNLVYGPPLFDPDHWQANYRLYRGLAPTILLPNSVGLSYAPAAALATDNSEQVRIVGWHHSDDPAHYEHLSYYEPIVHTFVSVSRQCAAQLAALLPHRKNDILHLPYGVVVPPHRSREPLTGRPLRLVYAGRMEQIQKRIFDLVLLAQDLDRRGVRFQMRLVGFGSQAEEVRLRLARVVQAFRTPGNAAWLEPPVAHAQMDDVWQWADVALNVSAFEGLSISMLEAMASGCVPVVTRVESGVNEVLRENENGLTAAVGDVPQLAAHIEALSFCPGILEAMSVAARESIAAYCGYESFVDRAKAILDEVAGLPHREWPSQRAIQMPTALDYILPPETPNRLRGLLCHIAEQNAGPVAIFCAGKHTRALVDVWKSSPVPIVAALDEEAKPGAKLWSLPILPPQRASSSGARSVIISSWLHEPAIWERHHQSLKAAGIHLYRLYADVPTSVAVPA